MIIHICGEDTVVIKDMRTMQKCIMRNLNSSCSIIRMIPSMRMTWGGGGGERRNAYRISVGICERKRLLEDLCMGGRIILK
jgi:hypothetical protein